MIKKIAFVSFRSSDLDADKRLWGELLGLPLAENYEGRWLEFETPDGKTVALETVSPEGTKPTLALETDDIEAEVARLRKAGVKFRGDVMSHPTCKMAFLEDSSGNVVMLHEIAPERAKG